MPTRREALAVLACALAAPRAAAAAAAVSLEALLARYVVPHEDGIARVRYAAWAASAEDRAALSAWIEAEAARAPSRMPREEAFAYWANLYNALTLKEVLDHFPVRSIRDIASRGVPFDPKGWFGPWRTRLVTVEGRRLSLDDIEHGIMRPTFGDPRVHYAVNCAALGCPNLRPAPWRTASLERDLDEAASAFVNHRRGVTVRPDGGLRVSSIYVWFAEDFGGRDAVPAHLRRHAAPPLAARLGPDARIAEDAYDWSLNAAA
ncbi:DUF547 domain-containing protein [Elioraea rosea]|uniref:DUF547 domain-containing protein n=1 Tax=Elioraea rosea TaxID=2492390 RepID=UPI0013157F05|nr:DUF547 domain-containing protein [Elioraea rosea]